MLFLNDKIYISIEDKRIGKEKSSKFYFEGGIKSFVDYLTNDSKAFQSEPYYIDGFINDVIVNVGLKWTESYSDNILSFVNNINTREGGTHVMGFRSGLTKAMNEAFKNSKISKKIFQILQEMILKRGLQLLFLSKYQNLNLKVKQKVSLVILR